MGSGFASSAIFLAAIADSHAIALSLGGGGVRGLGQEQINCLQRARISFGVDAELYQLPP